MNSAARINKGSIYSKFSMYEEGRYHVDMDLYNTVYPSQTMVTDYLENPGMDGIADVGGVPMTPVYRVETHLKRFGTTVALEFLSPVAAMAAIQSEQRDGFNPRAFVVTHIEN